MPDREQRREGRRRQAVTTEAALLVEVVEELEGLGDRVDRLADVLERGMSGRSSTGKPAKRPAKKRAPAAKAG